MIQPSQEQEKIVELIGSNNVIVDSVAGSGKTTTNIFISKRYSKRNILLLTYNKKLKDETTQRFKDQNIKNTEIHTFHSFCYRYYLQSEIYDEQIQIILDSKIKNKKPFKFDLIIIDEAQDMTSLYFKLILKICKENQAGQNFTFGIMGDYRQCIYQFKGADKQFILLADEIFGKLNNFPWERSNLCQSFRLTKQMGDFINKSVLKDDRIQAKKIGNQLPRYLICDGYLKQSQKQQQKQFIYSIQYQILRNEVSQTTIQNIEKYQSLAQSVILEVFYYLAKGYKYEDIFIIAPSVKEKTPASVVANDLSEYQLPLLVTSEDSSNNEQLYQNKIVLMTYHKSKGLERKVVIVLNFDDSYHKYYLRNEPTQCSNTHYVAITRSQEKLTIVQFLGSNPLPFLDLDKLKETTQIFGQLEKKQVLYENKRTKIFTNPQTLTSFLQQDVVDKALSFLNIECIQEKGKIIEIPNQTQQKFNNDTDQNNQNPLIINENVSEINEIALNAYLDIDKNKQCFIFENFETRQIEQQSNPFQQIINQTHTDKMKKLIEDEQSIISNLKISDLLFMSTYHNALKNSKIHTINQITQYDWMSQEMLNECNERLKPFIKNNCILQSQESTSSSNYLDESTLTLETYLSCIQDNEYWEIKFIDNISQVHLLYFAIQKYIYLKSIQLQQVQQYQLEKILMAQQQIFHSQSQNMNSNTMMNTNNKKEEQEKKILNPEADQENEINGKQEKSEGEKDSKMKLIQKVEKNGNNQLFGKEQLMNESLYTFKFINVKDGQIYQENSKLSEIEKMLYFLINQKYAKKEESEDFISFMKNIKQLYSKYYEKN